LFSSAGVFGGGEGFSEIFGGEERARFGGGGRYVCLPTGVVHIKKAGTRSKGCWTTEGTGKIRKKDKDPRK
jgi:hypothetical protein